MTHLIGLRFTNPTVGRWTGILFILIGMALLIFGSFVRQGSSLQKEIDELRAGGALVENYSQMISISDPKDETRKFEVKIVPFVTSLCLLAAGVGLVIFYRTRPVIPPLTLT